MSLPTHEEGEIDIVLVHTSCTAALGRNAAGTAENRGHYLDREWDIFP